MSVGSNNTPRRSRIPGLVGGLVDAGLEEFRSGCHGIGQATINFKRDVVTKSVALIPSGSTNAVTLDFKTDILTSEITKP